ncbi:mutator family transposase [Actinocorallia herbida]|uniref:Mutator family transposase n=1 Tax=Actinocorallia herbida TaxID=58109 RepID=A0A3N1D3D9_9ACTN|nr:mutator family transposase [Actinocorallia herbida]
MAVCVGPEGLPEAINGTWPQTVVQTSSVLLGLGGIVCIVHLLRHTFRYVPRRHWPKLAEALTYVHLALMSLNPTRRRAGPPGPALESRQRRLRPRLRGHLTGNHQR